MKQALLNIKNLTVAIDKRVVVETLDMEIDRGEVIGLTGENGSGKSSLAMTIMGSSNWVVQGGTIEFVGSDLLGMTIDERAREGIYVSWQSPVVIPGVSILALGRAIYELRGKKIESMVFFRKKLEELAKRVGLTSEHIKRSINDGFSGGERKRVELMLLLLLEPKLVVLDEIDSGLDESGRGVVVEIVKELKSRGAGIIVITHYQQLLDQIGVDKTWIMQHGRIQPRI